MRLFGCSHSRYTWPLRIAVVVEGEQVAIDYVACLACGAEFSYSWAEMKRGERLNVQRGDARGVGGGRLAGGFGTGRLVLAPSELPARVVSIDRRV